MRLGLDTYNPYRNQTDAVAEYNRIATSGLWGISPDGGKSVLGGLDGYYVPTVDVLDSALVQDPQQLGDVIRQIKSHLSGVVPADHIQLVNITPKSSGRPGEFDFSYMVRREHQGFGGTIKLGDQKIRTMSCSISEVRPGVWAFTQFSWE